jgi:hypothetical protein
MTQPSAPDVDPLDSTANQAAEQAAGGPNHVVHPTGEAQAEENADAESPA